jgi:DegV family protein with EDD domain
MEKIAIVSDVNAGLDYLGYDPLIPVLRSVINFGDEHYVDGIDIRADEFYNKLQTSTIIPSTSAPTIGEAMELLDSLVLDGYTDVIMYSISYELSSIGQMFETLQEEYLGKINIHVVNTKTATFLQGYLALTAKKMVSEGKSVSEVMDYSIYLIEHSHAYFVVDDLKYLVKNGRLSGAAGFVGTLLKIKPVLEMNAFGKIVSKEKVKTHRRAIEVAIKMFVDEIKNAKEVDITVLHTVREAQAKEIAAYFKENCKNARSVEIHMITPAVGAHIGCGVLGFGYYIIK